jgi:tRNA A-37 threonylcarbamoyl transferase component Bud32
MSNPTNNSHTEQVGGVRFANADAAALLGGHLAQCSNPDPEGWQIVKHNPSRTVYHGRIDDQEIYLKHYHGRSLIHRLRRLLGRSEAMREMAFSQYLSSRSVPTAPTLAARSEGGTEWLATRAVTPAVPGDKWHEQQLLRGRQGQREIQKHIAALAKLIGKMHRAGVVHQDLHCGNVMIQTDTHKPRLVLMDLHRMTRRRRLSRRMMAANIAQLFHDRQFFTTRSERLRFLKHYLPVCGAAGTLRGWKVLVENFARRHTGRQHAQRDRRIMGLNRYFTPITSRGGWRGHVVLASKRRLGGSAAAELVLQAKDWREVLADPKSLLYGPDVTEIKDSHSARIVRRKLKIGPHELDIYIKQPRQKRFLKRLMSFVRPSRPLRAFRMGHELLTRRIATALPLAVMERRFGPLLLESILITETVHAPHLYDFMNTQLSNPPKGDTSLSFPQQRQLAQEVLWQLGRMLQQLHDNFFAHRDLKATNIRVRWSPGERPEIVLLDLDGLARVRFMTARRKFRGLMRLNVSLLQCPVVNHAGQLRMLLGYLRRPGSGRIHFKPYWRVLEEWSARKLRQQIRSRRRRQKAIRRPA